MTALACSNERTDANGCVQVDLRDAGPAGVAEAGVERAVGVEAGEDDVAIGLAETGEAVGEAGDEDLAVVLDRDRRREVAEVRDHVLHDEPEPAAEAGVGRAVGEESDDDEIGVIERCDVGVADDDGTAVARSTVTAVVRIRPALMKSCAIPPVPKLGSKSAASKSSRASSGSTQ